MKKLISVGLIVLVLLMTVYSLMGISNAGFMSSDLSDSDDSFGHESDAETVTGSVKTVFGTATAVIKVVAVAVAVIMLLTIAVKYMTAAPGEKANVTKSALQFLIGALVIFGAVGILTIIENFSSVI